MKWTIMPLTKTRNFQLLLSGIEAVKAGAIGCQYDLKMSPKLHKTVLTEPSNRVCAKSH